MMEKELSSISLVKKIINKMFESIEGSDEFDNETIQKLKELNTREELHKANEVKKAIIPNRRMGNETN